MAEPSTRQGWRVPQRTPTIVAVALLTLIVVVLTIAGRAYRTTIRPHHFEPVETFPAPGIETYVHDGQGDPPRSRPDHREDPAIAAAKRAVLAEGIRGWAK